MPQQEMQAGVSDRRVSAPERGPSTGIVRRPPDHVRCGWLLCEPARRSDARVGGGGAEIPEVGLPIKPATKRVGAATAVPPEADTKTAVGPWGGMMVARYLVDAAVKNLPSTAHRDGPRLCENSAIWGQTAGIERLGPIFWQGGAIRRHIAACAAV